MIDRCSHKVRISFNPQQRLRLHFSQRNTQPTIFHRAVCPSTVCSATTRSGDYDPSLRTSRYQRSQYVQELRRQGATMRRRSLRPVATKQLLSADFEPSSNGMPARDCVRWQSKESFTIDIFQAKTTRTVSVLHHHEATACRHGPARASYEHGHGLLVGQCMPVYDEETGFLLPKYQPHRVASLSARE